jgi:hypothetical protein
LPHTGAGAQSAEHEEAVSPDSQTPLPQTVALLRQVPTCQKSSMFVQVWFSAQLRSLWQPFSHMLRLVSLQYWPA